MCWKNTLGCKVVYLVLVILLLVTAVPGCGAGGGGKRGSLSLGGVVELATETVASSGGTMSITKPGYIPDGFQIEVPAGSYADSRTFKISYAPIMKHSFGDDFNPITPLITVTNGGGYSEEIMSVTIPVEVPPDYFAMGFLYDDEAGKLEGIPLVAQDADSITLGTRHFSSFVVSMISKAALKEDIDTGFKPGVDDWQFTNYGSYIAQGGHCAGQSVTALWYYCTKPDGKGATLYGRYDNNGNQPATPNLWEDDTLGYRFASTVHKDINWSSFENKFWTKLAGVNDEVTWNLFAYSMQLTGEPQEVGIFSKAGGGHDMICYRINNGNLYIADPNYPGDNGRRIEYANGTFKPYNSGADAAAIAAGEGKQYETIEYCAKTTTVDWDKIARRWAEFEDKTIGNDRFPDYTLEVVEDSGVTYELKDGFNTDEKMLKIELVSGVTTGWIAYRDGVKLPVDAKGKIELKPGNNLLGFYILGEVGGKWKWVDFKYFNVYYEAPETPLQDYPIDLSYISGVWELPYWATQGPEITSSVKATGKVSALPGAHIWTEEHRGFLDTNIEVNRSDPPITVILTVSGTISPESWRYDNGLGEGSENYQYLDYTLSKVQYRHEILAGGTYNMPPPDAPGLSIEATPGDDSYTVEITFDPKTGIPSPALARGVVVFGETTATAVGNYPDYKPTEVWEPGEARVWFRLSQQ